MIYKCEYCKIEFPDYKDYKLHMSTHMSMQEQIEVQKVSSVHVITDISKLNIDLNRHIFISGQTQRGKSYFVKRLIESLPKTQKTIFVDYKHDPNHLEFISKFKIFKTLKGIKSYFSSDKEGILNRHKKDMRIVYRPDRIKSDNVEIYSMKNPRWKLINDLCDYVFAHGNITLIIDESAPFSSPHKIPPNYYDLMIMGAARGVTVWNITQRPTNIHNSVISESYTKILFRHDLQSDRDKIQGFIGKENAEELKSLPSRVFLINLSNGKTYSGTLKIT